MKKKVRLPIDLDQKKRREGLLEVGHKASSEKRGNPSKRMGESETFRVAELGGAEKGKGRKNQD